MTVDNAASLINQYLADNARNETDLEMAWRTCYTAFAQNQHKFDDPTVDYLSLHLGFYLAVRGAYQGRTFLVSKSAKIHAPVVRILQENQYDQLRGIYPDELCEEFNLELVMNLCERIRDAYAAESPAVPGKPNNATEVLITKVLLGTMGCTPAFDRPFIEGLRKSGIATGTFSKDTLRAIASFYSQNKDEFDKVKYEISQCGVDYAPMKMMDMCIRQVRGAH